jgi:hypothetical protein
MSDGGVFAIDRGLFDHPFFKAEPFTEREAWSWMIGEAAFESTKVRVGRVVFAVERGQFVHAIRFMAGKWKWSEPRVRRFLERLKTEQMIEALATSEATIITVCNYDVYQFARRAGDEPATNSRRREEESKNLGGGSKARAREGPLISKEAMDFADELARIAGHDPQFLPPKWVGDGPAYRVQIMFDAGWRVDVMRETAKAMMRTKRDGPPSTVRYFEKGFARAHQPQLPLPTIQLVRENGHEPYEAPTYPASDWRSRNDARHAAKAELKRYVQANSAGSGGGSG